MFGFVWAGKSQVRLVLSAFYSARPREHQKPPVADLAECLERGPLPTERGLKQFRLDRGGDSSQTSLMKEVPGIKLIGFGSLVLLVIIGVVAFADDKEPSSKTHPKLIVKFGWEGATPETTYPLNYDTTKFTKFIQRICRNDATRYKIKYYVAENAKPIEHIGELEVCPEPEPNPKTTSTSASAEPSATASPKRVKTQITQAAAFGTVKEALTFLQELKAES